MQLLKRGIVISIIIIFIITICSPICLAFGDGGITAEVPQPTVNSSNGGITPGSTQQPVDSSIGGGILYVPIQWLVGIITAVLEIIGETITGRETVTPGDIIFNDVELVNINFFSQDSSLPFVKAIRDSVAKWYYGIRTIAIVASLCVLIYISIRMVISTSGEEKGKFKTMFKDWLVSFALIFVLHYMMMLVIYGNNALVDIFKTALSTGGNQELMTSYLESLKELRWWPNLDVPVAQKFGANLVCLLLAGLTLGFIIMYIKRFIVVAFLIIIAPLITITYSIDKVKDGNSQALNTWGKEFFWTILIQPFHCLIYLVFVTTSLSLIKNSDFASSFLAIFCMSFILQAENIVKKIFGIQAENIGKLSAVSALVAGGVMGSMRGLKRQSGKVMSKAAGKSKSRERNNNLPSMDLASDKQTPQTPPAPGIMPNSPKTPEEEKVQKENKEADKKLNDLNKKETDIKENQQQQAQKEIDSKFKDSPKVQEAILRMADAIREGTFTKAVSTVGRWYAKAGFGLAAAGLTLLDDPDGFKAFMGAKAGFALGDYAADKEQAMRNSVGNLMERKVEQGRLKNRQADFDKAYEEYKKSTEKTEEEIIERIEQLNDIKLSGRIGSKIQGVERNLAIATQNLYDQLEKMEEDNPLDEVISRVKLKDIEE